jgi:DNA-binding NarL/FixJ family response regulator
VDPKRYKAMRAYYLTADLFFSSRVVGVAQQLGVDLRLVNSVDNLLKQSADAQACRLVILDLTLPQLELAAVVPAIKKHLPQARVVAYGPHVHVAQLEAAQAAGCDEVLARGAFNAQIERVLREATA